MGMVPSTESECSSPSQIIDQQLGEAYLSIQTIVENLDEIQKVAAALADQETSRADFFKVSTRAELTATTGLTANMTRWLAEPDFEGMFVYQVGDYSSEVANDLYSLHFLPPDSDTSGSIGAWVRKPDTTLTAFMLGLPKALSYGPRIPLTTVPQALAALETLHLEIVGDAKDAGTTGGYGYPTFYVKNPSHNPDIEYSFGWAREQARLAGGGQIHFEGKGQISILLPERLEFTEEEKNLTIYAPGHNVTFWCERLGGAVLHYNKNHIWKNIYFRPIGGPINGTALGEEVSRAKTLVDIEASYADKIAFLNCEFRHPSWHCLDATKNTADASLFRMSVQNCIFWGAIQGHLLGVNNSGLTEGTFTDDNTPRTVFVTFYETIWAYGLQRNPKVLGAAYVDVVNCISLLTPYPMEYIDSAADAHESVNGGIVQEGGWLRMRGCLAFSGHARADNRNATYLSPGYSTNTGRIDIVDCVAENGLIYNTRDGELLPAIRADLPHSLIPEAGPAREDWIDEIWGRAGAGIDAAPEGLFRWIEGVDDIPEGEMILIDRRDRTGQWKRINPLSEYPVMPEPENTEVFDTTPRSTTKIIGFETGSPAARLLANSTLDIAGATSSYFFATGNSGPGTCRDIVSTEDDIVDGLTLELSGSASSPLTLKNVAVHNVTSIGAPTNTIVLATPHNRNHDVFQVVFSTTGTLPAPLVAGKVYYGFYYDATKFKIALTAADALNLKTLPITGTGSGAHTVVLGNLNLPGGRDIILDDSSKILRLRYNSANNRFSVFTGPVNSVAGRVGDIILAKADVGLGNVDNTTDANKPISTATQAALNAKADKAAIPEISSGVFNPPATLILNATAAVVSGAQYIRIGNVVHVSLSATITATATGTDTQVMFDLPVPSDLQVNGDLTGVGAESTSGATKPTGPIFPALGANAALYRFTADTTSARDHFLTYSYRVR